MAYYNLNDASIPEGATIRILERPSLIAGAYRNYILLKKNYATVNGVPCALFTSERTPTLNTWADSARDDYSGGALDKEMVSWVSPSSLSSLPPIFGNMGYSVPGLDNQYCPYIQSVPIQYKDVNDNVKGPIYRTGFALSRAEVGFSGGVGSAVPYFSSDARRKSDDEYWLRDGTKIGLIRAGVQVGKDGKKDDAYQTESRSTRPAFCFPQNLTIELNSGTYTAIPNTSPLPPGAVTVNGGATIMAGQPYVVSWGASSDDQAAQYVGYEVYRSTDNGATYTLRGKTQGITTFTDTIAPYAATTVRYRIVPCDTYTLGLWSANSSSVSVTSNAAPAAPPSINVGPLPLVQTQSVNVSWGASTDQDGNLAGYRLYLRVNGGAWGTTPVYEGGACVYNDTLGKDWTTVQYRVCAYDSYGAASGFRESATYSLKPLTEITVEQYASSGIKDGSTYTADSARTLTFAASNTVDPGMTGKYTWVLKCDGALVDQQSTVVPGGVYSYNLTKFQWQCILNGQHTYTLTVSDAEGNGGTASITFTKNITQVIIKSVPFFVEINVGIVKNAMMTILGAFPLGSTLLVEVCNNAKDPSPVWQEILPGQLDGGYFPVTNTTVAEGNWFQVRVILNRGTATAACWIGQISGMAGLSQTFILGQENERLRADLDQEIEDREAADLAIEQKIETNRLAAFKQKGSVASFANLPTNAENGDVWETADTGDEWYWTGTAWKPYGPTIVADTVPTDSSTNLITSGGVYVALQNVSGGGGSFDIPTVDTFFNLPYATGPLALVRNAIERAWTPLPFEPETYMGTGMDHSVPPFPKPVEARMAEFPAHPDIFIGGTRFAYNLI